MPYRVIGYNDEGYRVGEGHPRATIPDAVIHRIRELHEKEDITYRELAKRFEISIWHVGKICRYERRSSVAHRYERVKTTSIEVHVEGQ